MPIFDYRCTSCGHRFEELVTRATEAVKCARCGASATKLLSVFAAPSGGSDSGDSGWADDSCACHPDGGGCGGFDD